MKADYLPPRPDQVAAPTSPTTAPAPAPKKHGLLSDVGTAVKILLAFAVIAGLMVWGAIAIGTQQRENTEAAPIDVLDPIEPLEPSMTFDEAAALAAPLADLAADELEFITAISPISEDVQHLRNAADLMDEAAALFEGVDETQVMYLTSAAGHLRASADAEAAGRWGVATAELRAFSDDIDAATANVEASAY